MIHRLAITLLCVAATAVAASAQLSRTVIVPKSSYRESYPSRALIGSNAAIVGWHGGPIDRPLSRADVTVAGIQSADRTVCITVEHVSGGYIGTALLPLVSKDSRQTFRLPATIFSRRQHIRAADLSVLVQVSTTSRCTSRSPTLTASWGPVSLDRDYSIYLNSGRGTVSRVSMVGLADTVPCMRLDDLLPDTKAVRQRFNTVCRVRLPRTCQPSVPFEIVTDAGDKAAPPTTGTLRRSCGV